MYSKNVKGKKHSSGKLYLFILLIILTAGFSSFLTYIIISKIYNKEYFPSINPSDFMLKKGDMIEVKLFFLKPDSDKFAFEVREIKCVDSILKNIEKTLSELIKGPKTKLITAIPEGTELLSLFLDNENNLYLNFNNLMKENHPCGIDAEYQTIYSLYNTIYNNFGNINSIKILLEGEITFSLCDHLDLTSPIETLQDFNLKEGCSEMKDDYGQDANIEELNTEPYPTYKDSSQIPLYNPDENNTIDEEKVD